MAPIRVPNIEEPPENFKGNSQGQQSQEKPLRMYYTIESSNEDKDDSKSIENYIEAHLPQNDEFDTHEQYEYIKRRNSMESEPEELQTISDDDRKVKVAFNASKSNVKSKVIKLGRAKDTKSWDPKAIDSKYGIPELNGNPNHSIPLILNSRLNQKQPQNKSKYSYKQKFENEEIPQGKLFSDKNSPENIKKSIETAEVNISPHEFDSSEIRSLIENDPDMRALIKEVDVPYYHHIEKPPTQSTESEKSSGDTESASKESNRPQISSSVFSTLDKRKTPQSWTTQLAQPYKAQLESTQVPSREAGMYSFEMLYNNEPSDTIVFKTNLRQKHAQRVDFEKGSAKIHQAKSGYPLKFNNYKQMVGKCDNHLLCQESNKKTPTATSYQLQEFFRSSGA